MSVANSKSLLPNKKSHADDGCDGYPKHDPDECENYKSTNVKNTFTEEKQNSLEDEDKNKNVNVAKNDSGNVDKGRDKNIGETQNNSGNMFKNDEVQRVEKLNNEYTQTETANLEGKMNIESNFNATSKTQRNDIGSLAKNIKEEKNGQRIALTAVPLSIANAILKEEESTVIDDAGEFMEVKRKDKKRRNKIEDTRDDERKQKLAESLDQNIIMAVSETLLLENIAESKVKQVIKGESKTKKEDCGILEKEEKGNLINNVEQELKFDSGEKSGILGEKFTETVIDNVEKLKRECDISRVPEKFLSQVPSKQPLETFLSSVRIGNVKNKDGCYASKGGETGSSLECSVEVDANGSESEKDSTEFQVNKGNNQALKNPDVKSSFVDMFDDENCMKVIVKQPSHSANGADSNELGGEIKVAELSEIVDPKFEDKLAKKGKKSDETRESIVSTDSVTGQSFLKDSIIINPQKKHSEFNPLEKTHFENIHVNVTDHKETQESKSRLGKDERNNLNKDGYKFGENKKKQIKMEVPSEKKPTINECLVKQRSENGPEDSSMVEENEDIFEVRPVFMSNVCHVCKETHRGETILKSCAACRMIAYCSSEHQKQHWPEHKDVCRFVRKELKKRQHRHLYQSAKNSDYETWKRIRYTTMMECEDFIKRALQPYEREMFLFARHCESCYETDGEKLHQCKKCLSSFFCSPDHKKKDHDRWCSDLKLLFDINVKQAKIGPIDPPLPDRVFQNYEILPDNIKEFLVTKMLGPKRSSNYDNATFSCLTEFASYPLTVIYAIQALEKVISKGKGTFKPTAINSLNSIVIHVVGAELIFECNNIIKWDIFFAHLLPNLKYLRIVFIGPDLVSSPCIIPTGVCNEDLRCPRCSSSGRNIEYDFQPDILYQDYVKTKHYIKPTVIIAFNCGLYRDTGHSERDTWAPCIEYLTKDPFIPLILTAYTSEEAPKDVERVMRTVKAEVLVKPQRNPYRSYKPCRNFINEDSIPVMYKNNYFSILRGTETA
ncbi:hypothetical protein QYM36_005573 [Artemia franciscana]|uniref:MYND-type domain-containing protein n=2 Tax=Artemia franciscana TaxID=6661 RepID=A0AA88HY49_ARTSF|nr:hypothetical protein QYM36_005573 [Artemia franciscana]